MGFARISTAVLTISWMAAGAALGEPTAWIDGAKRDLNVDFTTLALDPRPNRYLVCPPGYCGAEPHRISPEYDVSVSRLLDWWLIMARAQPRVERLATDVETMEYHFVQRSQLFGFPDLITVRFIALGDKRSTFAVYSRSIHGFYDLGVNSSRVDTWIDALPKWSPPLASDH